MHHTHLTNQTEPETSSHWKTIRTLSRYLWPAGRNDLRVRVILAFACLIFSKLINVYVPFLYKGAVDALSPEQGLVALPVFLIVGYGVARVLTQAFNELRSLFFIRVSQHAQRVLSLNTFQHLHELSLRFHLDRQTGGLSRVIERGIAARVRAGVERC